VIEEMLRLKGGQSATAPRLPWTVIPLRLMSSLLGVLGAAVLARLLVFAGFPSPETLSLLFAIPVLVSAALYGFWFALAAAFASVFAFNFVLLPPLWSISLSDPENAAKAAVLGIIAIVASALSARVRTLALEAQHRERILAGVYALSQDMLGIVDLRDMKAAAEAKLTSLLGQETSIILVSERPVLDDAANAALESRMPAGGGTRQFPDCSWLYLPLINRETATGVVKTSAEVSAGFSLKTLATLAAQVASALEKARLAEAQEKKVRDAEREAFLSALLSSVSHDLKTPLVTVIGALSSLKESPPAKGDPAAREIVAGALEEAEKLRRFLTNLIEISRLESGLETLHREPVSLRDILASALRTLHPMISGQKFSIVAAPDFPLLNVNPALMELVVLNLLDNALKYGPPEGDVKIIARWDGEVVTIDIDDDGEGLPPSEREAIFVKFYRAKHGDRKVAGTGLGLYICRGIVAAHGGTIAAIDPNDGQGACIRITLPAAAALPFELLVEAEEAV
jgi:two-component system sensor histidine kinase KdpD